MRLVIFIVVWLLLNVMGVLIQEQLGVPDGKLNDLFHSPAFWLAGINVAWFFFGYWTRGSAK